MNISLEILIGLVFQILGFPIGDYLAKITKEELSQGRKWFQRIIFISIIGSILSIVFKNDALLFTFLFIIIVTSRSLNPRIGKK